MKARLPGARAFIWSIGFAALVWIAFGAMGRGG